MRILSRRCFTIMLGIIPTPQVFAGFQPLPYHSTKRVCRFCAVSTGWITHDTLNLGFHDTIGSGVIGNNIIGEEIKVMSPTPSSVERLLIRDRLVYIKRDDALYLPYSNISGNKGRKFLSLNNIPALDFPDVIVSYGGPQSNAMVALAAIVSSKNALLHNGQKPLDEDKEEIDYMMEPGIEPIKRFVYYTKKIPRYLRQNPNGNLLRAMALGMDIRTLSHDKYDNLFGGLHGGSVMAPADLDPPLPGRSLWIPQGGACSIAQPGSDMLAREIVDFWSTNGKGMPLSVCLPGGTCTTALLLHRSIDSILKQWRKEEKYVLDIRVVVIPCVGDDEYAMRQMTSLNKSISGEKGRGEDMPWILKRGMDGSARRRSAGYFTFGEPSKAIIDTFDEMNKEYGLFLDLLYGAPAFNLLLQHWTLRDACPIAGRQIMYIHSGGLEGVASQLTRYKHKGLIDARTIQIS